MSLLISLFLNLSPGLISDSGVLCSVGTPGIYRDFGFVEQSSQIWSFLDHNIYFEIYEDDGIDGYDISFDEDDEGNILYGFPDEAGLRYLQEQLERLEEMNSRKEFEGPGDIPKQEWDSIMEYYEAFVDALEMAIEYTEEINEERAMEEMEKTNDEL